ncbi:MAG: efflux RND transporter periplasmic adaptor subunit [Rhodobacteraceae bacterium]|jgi:HlyD family secretion protein|nr:efflux RND transporter periplasmic adaptor subunit [Paracoccaceae bacterium]
MRKIVVIVVAAVAVLAGGWYLWTQRQATDTGGLVFYGNVDIRQVALAFDGSGRIAGLRAEEGDAVTAGSVIGLLDTRSLELQAEAQEAAVDAQRQTVLKLRNGPRPEEVEQARAQVASSEASFAFAQQELDRVTRLQASRSGAASQQSVDQALAEAKAAEAAVNQTRAALALIEAGSRSEDIAIAEAQLRTAEVQLQLLRHQIDQGQLRAPDDGVIRSRLREPGDMVTSASPVFSLALIRPKWVRIYVSEPDLGRVQPGMAARVETDSFPGQPVAGKVGYISSVAEFTPKTVQTEELRTSLVYEVHVVVEDVDNRLRLGQPVTVRLQDGPSP